MEDPDEILMNSLTNFGVPIPPTVSSIKHLDPETLFAICSHAIRLIEPTLESQFPATLPQDSMTDRVNICTDLAEAFKNIGFVADLNFHKFLYPSEENLYKLVRFLVGRLSEARIMENVRGVLKEKVNEDRQLLQNEEVLKGLEVMELKTVARKESNSDLQNEVMVKISVEGSRPTEQDHCHGDQDGPQLLTKSSELLHLEEELELLKTAVEMIVDSQHPVEFYIDQINDQVEAKKHRLKELESEWDAVEKPLQERKKHIEQSLCELYPEAYRKLTRTKEIETETESVLAEIKRREEEMSRLSSDLAKQPKMSPRKSYIERINEITKNSRKQDTDIQRILKDTRELQLESNTVQERLNRTYAVVEETIFREAKKDPVARQAHRLLTSIHGSFEQIAEKILATDRSRRDVTEYEAKLAIMKARSLNVDEIQADLDAMGKENELLEKRLHNI